MFVIEKKISKNQKEYLAVYWEYPSGKRFRLTLPFPVVRALAQGDIVEVKYNA